MGRAWQILLFKNKSKLSLLSVRCWLPAGELLPVLTSVVVKGRKTLWRWQIQSQRKLKNQVSKPALIRFKYIHYLSLHPVMHKPACIHSVCMCEWNVCDVMFASTCFDKNHKTLLSSSYFGGWRIKFIEDVKLWSLSFKFWVFCYKTPHSVIHLAVNVVWCWMLSRKFTGSFIHVCSLRSAAAASKHVIGWETPKQWARRGQRLLNTRVRTVCGFITVTKTSHVTQ